MTRAIVAALVITSSVAHARDARVTAVTPTTIYIDAGTTDGLAPGVTWNVTIDGKALGMRVAAVASHDAVIEVEGAPPPLGTVLALPAELAPPAPVTVRPAPVALPAWADDPGAIGDVQRVASHEQPANPRAPAETVVTGEIALSAFLAADATGSSTSSQDLSLASQLEIENGAWRYDHVIDAHLAASPELATAPLQNAQARFDIYLMRLAYAPAGARYAAALGRQPAAPLGELGTVDGATARLALDRRFDVTAFAGLRPASDLGLSRAPRAGVDLGWQLATTGGVRARADAGIAVDEYLGTIDRALAAVSSSLSTERDVLHADATFDLAADANGKGARLTRASVFARTKRGRLTASAQAGYDRPFWDRLLVVEAPDLLLGPRTYAQAEATYALHSALDLSSSARLSRGDGFTSTEADLTGAWHAPSRRWLVTAAPFAVVGSLVTEYGVRTGVDFPFASWSLGLLSSFQRVSAAGELAWSELGRISGSRPIFDHWRTSLSLEAAAGDGPTRVLLFGLLAYRFGKP